jgi:hypothetical protein
MPLGHHRVDPGEWPEFIAATNGEHAEILRQFVSWYLRKPRARLPKRPDAGERDAGASLNL